MIAVAMLTIAETVRRRFALAALLGTLVVAALTAWGLHALRSGAHPMTPLEARSTAASVLPLLAYLFSFVLAFAAAMLAASMLSAEVESGVLLPVLARPISRTAVVLGKALGLGVVLAVYAAFACLLEFAVVDAVMGFFPPHPFQAVAALAGVAIVVLVFTLALASRLQTIAAGILAVTCFGIGWIAGIVSDIGQVHHNATLLHAGTLAQLLMPADALWRVAVYRLEPASFVAQLQANAARGGWSGPFWVAASPPPATIAWAVAWIVVVLAIAARSFSTRDV